jgi:Rab GDP dissociation inhibitor
MKEIFAKFKLEENTIDFLGHAIAMYSNDNYLNLPAIDTIHRIKLYMDSIGRYGDSPFLYPIYGLGGIPEGFSRYCAIHGGTYMLNTPVEEIIFNEEGKVTGIKSGDQVAKAPLVICDPSYAQGAVGKTKAIGKTIRCINILDHPIPNTNDLPSC